MTENLSTSKSRQTQNEDIGNLAGIAAGVLTGASVGSAVFPVVGTFAGALVGGILGSQVGRTVGGAVLNALDPLLSGDAVPTSREAAPDSDMISQLERLAQLRASGAISEEEFRAAKARLLGL